jgi:hypothetical protein
MRFGESLPKRRALIQQLSKAKPSKTFPIDFQGERKYLDVHSVSIDFPRYRLSNGRTGVDQLEYLARHPSLPKDMFAKPESDQAQEHQHNILKTMIDEADLKSYFRHHKQLEPLILDSDGFVINGNRRLCTMREYYHSAEKKKFQHFKNIDVVILPPSDQKAILELENKLQIQKDIKQGYKWFNTAFMFKRRLAEKMDSKDVQELYDVTNKELNHMLAMYDEAERYLASRGKSGQFSIIPDSKFAFDELVKALRTIDEEQKDAFLSLAYLVIEKADGRRAYDQIPKIAKSVEKILQKLPKAPVQSSSRNAGKASKELLGSKHSTKPSKVILPKLTSEKEKDKARETILDTIGEEDSRQRDRKKGDFVRVQLEKAFQALDNAYDDLSSSSDKRKLPALLAKIEAIVKKLRRSVGK